MNQSEEELNLVRQLFHTYGLKAVGTHQCHDKETETMKAEKT